MLSQLNNHLTSNDLLNPLQSAYRHHHSTITALLRTGNGFLAALDNGNVCILTYLDFCGAFDTIDHNMLLHKLEQTFGITDISIPLGMT